MLSIQFRFLTGLKRRIFQHARLLGNWDAQGRGSPAWSETPMAELVAEDGCPAFAVKVPFDPAEVGQTFNWTVRLSIAAVSDVSGIATEVNDPNSNDRVQAFQLRAQGSTPQIEEHFFTLARRLGARKIFAAAHGSKPGLRFALWALNARKVDVVYGDPAHGYIADDGTGIDASRPPVPMMPASDGTWQTAVIADFAAHEGLPYMFRVTARRGAPSIAPTSSRDSRSGGARSIHAVRSGTAAQPCWTAPRAAAS